MTETADDLKTGYTPRGARAFDELQVFRDFNGGKDPLLLYILATANDGGSMARLEHLNATVEIIDHIGNDFAVKNLTYFDICENFCLANEPVRQYRNGLLVRQNNKLVGTDVMNLSYPLMRFIGRDLDLTPNFFGVKFTENQSALTNVDFLQVIVLHFRAPRPLEWDTADTSLWERSVAKYYTKEYNNTLVKPLVFSLIFTQDEVVRTGMSLFPFLIVGFLVMATFSLLTVYIGAKYNDQWTVHKISYAFNACVCPLMATATALGLLLILGLRFGSILAVTPFLVLAIGVDDAYLMINSWNINSLKRRGINTQESLRERIAEVLVDVGPSITITSLTNMLAFSIGAMSPTPEIQLLCIANTIALFFDWLYTITIYAAILCIGFKYEIKRESHALPKTTPTFTMTKVQLQVQYFLDSYCEWLSSGFTSLIVFLILCGYWAVCINGALSARAGLTPDKLFLSDSPMLSVSALNDQYVKPAYTFVTIYVTKAGNLSDSARVERVKKMVSMFEEIPGCNGQNFTKFWIRDYESFLKTVKEDIELDVEPYSDESIMQFATWPEYNHWGGFFKFNKTSQALSQFFITVAYHGSNQSNWNQRLVMLKQWRGIVDQFKDLGASIYEDDAIFTDQIETLMPATVQTSIMTLICMAVVCCVFMSNALTVVIAVASIMSICLGVFGLVTYWGVDVDPISVATLIMSIGLSVDFPAHITFHYYRTGLSPTTKTAKQRLVDTLSIIGFPLLQCSLSTILLVCSLLFVSCYMTEVFVKTIVLVISLGIIHALVAVPAILCTLSNLYHFIVSLSLPKATVANSFRGLEKPSR